MKSHTPGPWTLGKGKVTIREEAKGPRQGFIARCHIAGTYRVRDEEETEANAHLIAAAPELLEALKQLEDAVDFMQRNWTSQTSHHYCLNVSRLGLARAAIKKAYNQIDPPIQF